MTIVPTPAGFTPVLSVPGFVPKKKRSARLLEKGPQDSQEQKLALQMAPQFPQVVQCTRFIETTVRRASRDKACTTTKTITLQRPTVTDTVTSTFISTSTRLPSAEHTVTEMKTATVDRIRFRTIKSCTTETVISTSVLPTSTAYAACASDNLVGSVSGGQGILGITYNGPDTSHQVLMSAANSTYDCCVTCQTTTGCIFSSYLPGKKKTGLCNVVLLDDTETCNGTVNHETYFWFDSGAPIAPDSKFFVSNGPCGQPQRIGG